MSSAFVPAGQAKFAARQSLPLEAAAGVADEVDQVGNNVAVKNLLTKVSDDQLLTKVAKSGLLSKAKKAGVKLSNLEPFLVLAADNPEILVLVEASGPELLPILPTIVQLAPALLPVLATAISIPAPVVGALGVGALAAAGGAVYAIPDDSVLDVAAQTLIVGLAIPVAGVSFVGAAVLGQLTKK